MTTHTASGPGNGQVLETVQSINAGKAGKADGARRLRSVLFALAGVAGALLPLSGSGCGGGEEPGGATGFAEIRPLLQTSCALSSSCHAQSSAGSGNLSLSSADAYCALVGATKGATSLQSAKATLPKRVTPGSKDQSFLYKKLTVKSSESATYGSIMPLGQPLDQASIDKFARWIDGGALDDNMKTPAQAGCN